MEDAPTVESNFPPAAVAAMAVVSAALLGFAVWRIRGGDRLPLFFLWWFVALIGPVLPLRDHLTEYYVMLPLIGVCWLAGQAVVAGWRSGAAGRAAVADRRTRTVYLRARDAAS